jgi:uncharacterized membrane protein HdeD (DUF308 family)
LKRAYGKRNDKEVAMPAVSQKWWVMAIRGLLAIIFGLFAFFWPGMTLAALVLLFGAYAFADGAFAIAAAFAFHGDHRNWWTFLIEGLIGIGAGVVAFLMPGITALALLFVIAAWAVLTGVLEIAAAVWLRDLLEHEWLLGISGVLSVVFGVMLWLFPGAGALALIWWIGAYAIFFGALLIGLSFRLRGWQGEAGVRRMRPIPG